MNRLLLTMLALSIACAVCDFVIPEAAQKNEPIVLHSAYGVQYSGYSMFRTPVWKRASRTSSANAAKVRLLYAEN